MRRRFISKAVSFVGTGVGYDGCHRGFGGLFLCLQRGLGLGDGISYSEVPVQMTGLTNVTANFVGRYHTLVVGWDEATRIVTIFKPNGSVSWNSSF